MNAAPALPVLTGSERLHRRSNNIIVGVLLLSLALHGVLLAVKFTFPKLYDELTKSTPPLDVVLVNAKTASRPTKADALAQANLDGGGNTDENRRAKSPLPVANLDQLEQEDKRASKKVQELEATTKQLLTQLKPAKDKAPTEKPNEKPQERADETANTPDLVTRSMEMARLQAQISKEMDIYNRRPRRQFVGARTQEYRFAQYVEDWRIKVEKVGNLNYPEAAKQRKLYGSLQLTVNIRFDGTVESVEINRSSGHKILDAAAVRIVELAGPFAPFPESIRKDTDILGVTRTWMFTAGDQLTSE